MANKTPLILDTATLQLAELPSGDNLDLTGSGISSVTNITLTGQINGPSNLIIDPAAVGDDTGTVEIKGNLTVQGTTTTINSTTLSIDDKNIVLADGSANAAAADGAGITISGANATLSYASTGDRWVFNKEPFFNTSRLVTTSDLDSANTASKVVTRDASGNFSAGTITANIFQDAAGNLRSVPQNARTSAYTLVAGDNGEHISITTGGVTIPAGVFSVGDTVAIYNNSTSSQTITQGASVTLRLSGTANTGNRTLAQYGICTILCVASNTFVISGSGLS